MSAFVNAISRLTNGPPSDVRIYLDERGTPASDRLFLTGGVMAYGEADEISARWKRLRKKMGFGPSKGRDLSRAQLLAVAEFLIGQSVLPVAVWTKLTQNELDELRKFTKRYERATSPTKLFPKISGASWLWKWHMNQTIGRAIASFLLTGPIQRGCIFLDKMHEEKRKRDHYRKLLERYASKGNITSKMMVLGVPPTLRELMLGALPTSWQIDLNAKGPFAEIADVCCTMAGHYVDKTFVEPWDVLRIRHLESITKTNLPCIACDHSNDLRDWLRNELYTSSPR